MAAPPIDSRRFSLRRWSQRKLDAAREPAAPDRIAPVREGGTASGVDAPGGVPASAIPALRGDAASPASAPGFATTPATGFAATPAIGSASAPSIAPPGPLQDLPALDTLTIDSDYTAFMQPGVDAQVTRTALKKLFSDPRFNVMDGLDVYISDYSKPDPIDPAIVRTLVQARYIFNPPATRVNAEGYVEDVPELPEAEAATTDAIATAQPAAGAAPAPTGDADTAAPAPTGDAAAIGTGDRK